MSGKGAKWVVAIDFGTTFSGFAYAKQSESDEPNKVNTFYDWPCCSAANQKPYCKTQTSLCYVKDENNKDFKVQSWGLQALVERRARIRANRPSGSGGTFGGEIRTEPELHFLTHFKLLLAESYRWPLNERAPVPVGLSVERMIQDFLHQISQFALKHLQDTYGKKLTMGDIQWCLTVPAIWNEGAKQTMKMCAEKAGMVKLVDSDHNCSDGGSPFPVEIILEPEAASIYCQRKLKDTKAIVLRAGDKVMVVDVGGGTIDIVVHQKAGDDPRSMHVEEVVPSYGSLGGGTFVDTNFYDFLRSKIGCFDEFCKNRRPQSYLNKLEKWWLEAKMDFSGDGYPGVYMEDLPQDLADAWQAYDEQRGRVMNDPYAYTEMRLDCSDLKAIFDPEVHKVLDLIERHVREVRVLMVVGGFASSPYLRRRIKERFESIVDEVITPEEPGAAICVGAVQLDMANDPIRSRISKRTFGVGTSRAAMAGDPEELLFTDDDKQRMCDSVFDVFVREGEKVLVNASFKKTYLPVYRNQTGISFKLYSCPRRSPKYTNDADVKLEGEFTVKLKDKWYKKNLGKKREVEVNMEFGASLINVTARKLNFGNTKSAAAELSVAFNRLTT